MSEENGVQRDQEQFVSRQRTELLEFKWPQDAAPEAQTTIRVWYYKITRGMRQRAVDAAMRALMRQEGQEALKEFGAGTLTAYQSVIERELVGQCIKKWSLPADPRRDWDNIDMQLGDHIVQSLGIMDQLGGAKAMDSGKNLHAGASETTTAPATSTSSSSPTSSLESTVAR